MKQLLLAVLGSCFYLSVFGQLPHNDSDRIKSANWDIIGELKFDERSYSEIYPIYSSTMKKYKGKQFELEGYIVPLEKGVLHSRLMLSSLPLNQCHYCGRDGIPSMVLVELDKPVKYTLKPIKVSGILILENQNMLDGYPVLLKKARQIQ